MPFGIGAAVPGGRGVAAGMGGSAAMRAQKKPLQGQNPYQSPMQGMGGTVGGRPMSPTMANRFAATGPRYTQPGMRGLAPSMGAMGGMMGQAFQGLGGRQMPQYAPQVPQMQDYEEPVQNFAGAMKTPLPQGPRDEMMGMRGNPWMQGGTDRMGYGGGFGGGIGPRPDFMQNFMNAPREGNQFVPWLPPVPNRQQPPMFQGGGWRGMRDRGYSLAPEEPVY